MEMETQGDAEMGGGGHEPGARGAGGRGRTVPEPLQAAWPCAHPDAGLLVPELCVISVHSLDVTHVWWVLAKPRSQCGDPVSAPFRASCRRGGPKTPQWEG